MANSAIQGDILNRLHNIKGHIAGIERMVEEQQDCNKVLIQLSAVRASIEKVGLFILENNALECLLQGIEAKAEDQEKVVQVVKQMLSFLK